MAKSPKEVETALNPSSIRTSFMNYPIRILSLDDYDAVYRLWSVTEGMSLGEDDSRDGIALYLRKNPESCFVALDGPKIIGTVLCGHDGRRGILRHLAVNQEYRKQGIARSLLRAGLDALSAEGIRKCNVFIMDDNPAGFQFWQHIGFYPLEDNYRTLQFGTNTPFQR
jgi:ribosomal protein S18 acetylase RimI-like enzyme